VILLNLTTLGTKFKTIVRVRKRFVAEDLEAAIDHRPQPSGQDKDQRQRGAEVDPIGLRRPLGGLCHWKREGWSASEASKQLFGEV
jgi:hypothetical protein